ncbi:MAG: host attachment protein [Thiomicrospira sp.]|uniref:host attachment protein n=1 Tax=Thiomicrospira sp. TaxID=935 RepID=UPI0019E5C1F3|nr:host attachment protein [Thiomicrospira sp.]MBE0493634.1 host attachment protein [Thiomicrospira sp.]
MKFNQAILVIGNLSHLTAYRVIQTPAMDRQETSQISHTRHQGTPKINTQMQLIKEFDYNEARQKTSDLVSDQAGNFNNASGENHNLETEMAKRGLNKIGDDIKELINTESPESWYLAFPKQTHQQLVALLPAQTQTNLKKSLPLDLIKTDKAKLLSHFE